MKRFTETEKWRDPWFRKLSPAMKCFWMYLTDNCDHAGVWEVDMETAAFFVGEILEQSKVIEAFQERIERLPDKAGGSGSERWRVVKFVSFQYPNLSRECKPHNPVFAAIERHGLDEVTVASGKRIDPPIGKVFKALPEGSQSLLVREKEKEKEAVKAKAADPRHHEISSRWSGLYEAFHNFGYSFNGRDAVALKRLLCTCKETSDEILATAQSAWERYKGDRFANKCKQASTLHGLCDTYNEIRVELQSEEASTSKKAGWL